MSNSIYNVIEVIGISEASWEDAAKHAIEIASKSLRNLRVAEVVQQDLKIERGQVVAFRTRIQLSFKIDISDESAFDSAQLEQAIFDGMHDLRGPN